jgi:hypothetical protein
MSAGSTGLLSRRPLLQGRGRPCARARARRVERLAFVDALEVDAHLVFFRRPSVRRGIAALAAAVLAAKLHDGLISGRRQKPQRPHQARVLRIRQLVQCIFNNLFRRGNAQVDAIYAAVCSFVDFISSLRMLRPRPSSRQPLPRYSWSGFGVVPRHCAHKTTVLVPNSGPSPHGSTAFRSAAVQLAAACRRPGDGGFHFDDWFRSQRHNAASKRSPWNFSNQCKPARGYS